MHCASEIRVRSQRSTSLRNGDPTYEAALGGPAPAGDAGREGYEAEEREARARTRRALRRRGAAGLRGLLLFLRGCLFTFGLFAFAFAFAGRCRRIPFVAFAGARRFGRV